jgi:hypothetical protein
MFVEIGSDLKNASDVFRSWADSNSAVEGSRELRMASLDIQMAFASMGHFLHTKKVDQYRAMKLYIDIAERNLAYIPAEKKAVAESFGATVEYLKIRATKIDEKITEAREVDELVEFKRLEVRFVVEDAKALDARIADLKARLDSLKKMGGGAYRFPRRMSRAYCRRTPCRRMGFTQRASCRPYKNCYKGRGRRQTRKMRAAQ